jgi:hypothetical protein
MTSQWTTVLACYRQHHLAAVTMAASSELRLRRRRGVSGGQHGAEAKVVITWEDDNDETPIRKGKKTAALGLSEKRDVFTGAVVSPPPS